MNLYQTNLLIIALGALALLLIALAGGSKSPALFIAGLAAFVAVVLVSDMVAFATHLPPCHRTLWDSMGGKLLNFLKKVQF